MEVKIDKNRNIIIKHSLKKNETYKISEGKNFKGVTIYRATQLCMGYSSRTEDNFHILLLDYDNANKQVVIDEIRAIQERFSLSPAYLLTTKEKSDSGAIIGNYHFVILNKYCSRDAFEIMGYLGIDENFRDSPIRKASKSWVLRLGSKKGSGKPKFLEIIGNENLDREISTAHKKLLSKFFKDIKHPKYSNEDKLKKVCIQTYETR